MSCGVMFRFARRTLFDRSLYFGNMSCLRVCVTGAFFFAEQAFMGTITIIQLEAIGLALLCISMLSCVRLYSDKIECM